MKAMIAMYDHCTSLAQSPENIGQQEVQMSLATPNEGHRELLLDGKTVVGIVKFGCGVPNAAYETTSCVAMTPISVLHIFAAGQDKASSLKSTRHWLEAMCCAQGMQIGQHLPLGQTRCLAQSPYRERIGPLALWRGMLGEGHRCCKANLQSNKIENSTRTRGSSSQSYRT